MTYVSKKEKVFDLPDQEDGSSVSLIKGSDHRLKIFPSVSERASFTLDDCQKYQQLCGLLNVKESNSSKTTGFKYIPIDVLLTILMSEKDAYIQELLERQEKCTCGERAEVLFKAKEFDDCEDDKEALIRKDAEVVALKNRNVALESDLEECKDVLGKAMHKLESVEGIMNENSFLKDKLNYAEEMIKLLEESKKALEIELETRGRGTEVENGWREPDSMREQGTLVESDHNILQGLYNERESLKQEIETLQKELSQAKTNMEDVETLKRQSESVLLSLKEMSRENECYRQKLEGTKKLEKCVQDLRKQAINLNEKYKKELCRADEQAKQINNSKKELNMLLEERERLQKKIMELSSFESVYYDMKRRFDQVEQILYENELLNSRLAHLEKLESENEELRSEINKLKSREIEFNESKKKMMKMEREIMAQEDEIKGLVSQIEVLSNEYIEREEYNRLKREMEKKMEMINQNEKDLRQIPILLSQIEQLRGNLQKSMDELMSYKKSSEQLQDELEAYKEKCIKLEEMSVVNSSSEPTYIGMKYEEKLGFKEQLGVVQEVVDESCPVIELTNIEVKSEGLQTARSQTDDFEDCENSDLAGKRKLEQDVTDMLERTNRFKDLIRLKDEKIRILESEVKELKNNFVKCRNCQDVKNDSTKLQSDITALKDLNQQLQVQLSLKLEEEVRIEKLESTIQCQKKAIEFSKRLVRETETKLLSEVVDKQMTVVLSKLLKEEVLLSKKEISVRYLTEIENLKNEKALLKRLISGLKEENQMLQKMRIFTEFKGKRALENVLKKLRAELLVLQNLSKPELDAECRALQAEVKRLMEEADNLKVVLDAERKSKEYLEKELGLIQKELTSATTERYKSQSTHNAATMTAEYLDQSEEIKKTLNEIKILKEENNDFVKEIALLQEQCKDFQDEVTILQNNMDEMDRNIHEERNLTSMQKDEINALNERIRENEKEMMDLRCASEEYNQKSIALREELMAKEAELDKTKKELTNMRNDILKMNSEMETLRNRLAEAEEKGSKENEKADVEGKEGSEDTILRVEKEFDELREKLGSCKTAEEKALVLRAKRENLIVKVKSFESEVEFLKMKLIECDLIKTELEQLKAERKTLNDLQMNIESEEKLLSDIFGLREQLRLQQKEIEHARSENSNLKGQLHDLGQLLDLCKKLHKTTSQNIPRGEAASCDSMAWDETDTVRVDISTSCEKLRDTISVDEFKQEIAKIESKYKAKLQKMKKGNAEKIKRLVEQYEKESKNRNKAYNDSLNNIKSNYENDIRKLTERHKSSILRLQNLHEDEVQELNTNYETQMEAMQTLNENVVNDLTSGEVEKCKLTEKYNKEIQDVEVKYQKLLQEKENKHRIEIANLQDNLTRNINDLKDMHKQDIDNLSRIYEENMAQLEEKHNREFKKYKRNNINRTEMMRHKYEDLLTEERKKYEEQLQIMLERLKRGHQGDQEIEDEVKFVYLKKKTAAHSNGLLEFNDILQKIISEGLESIPFDELMLVHCKTCFAAANFFEELNPRLEHDADLISEGCPHMPLLKEDKEHLLKRIFILENEIAIKQLETHEAIVNMETAEKCRLEELNNLLRSERDKNAELKMMLTSQKKAQTDLKIESYMLDRQVSLHETNYIEKVKELEVERSEKRRLEDELLKERNNSKRLTLMLENERQRFKTQRKKESEYIQAMRMRLEEALSHEQIMESQLDYEAEFRTKLEFELQSLQRSFNLLIDQPSSALSLESKTVKDKRNLDQFESEKEIKVYKCKSRNKVKPHTNS